MDETGGRLRGAVDRAFHQRLLFRAAVVLVGVVSWTIAGVGIYRIVT